MARRIFIFVFLVVLPLLNPVSALAQDYYFRVDQQVVHVLWNEDGTLSLDYTLRFYNDTSGHAIEYVDLGLPSYNFDTGSIQAEIDGQPVDYISASEYEGIGSGVAVALRPELVGAF